MIALVDSGCAKPGLEFVYLGEAEECRSCKLRIPCHQNLEKGRRYLVVSRKEKSHPCKLFEEVSVCELQEVGIDVAMPPGLAFEGASIVYHPHVCKKTLCIYQGKCVPEGLKDGDRCTVQAIKGKMRCGEKGELLIVALKRI